MFKKFLVILVLVFVVQNGAMARVMMIPPTEQPQEKIDVVPDVAGAPQGLVPSSVDDFVEAPQAFIPPIDEKVAVADLPRPVGQSFPLVRALGIFSILLLGFLVFIKLRRKTS